MALQEAMPEVERADIRAAAQIVLGPLIQVSVHPGEHDASATLAVTEVLLAADHHVVRRRFHGAVQGPRGPLRDGVEDTDRLSAWQAARELRGTIDRRGHR